MARLDFKSARAYETFRTGQKVPSIQVRLTFDRNEIPAIDVLSYAI